MFLQGARDLQVFLPKMTEEVSGRDVGELIIDEYAYMYPKRN